jgi:hypothetical protein
MLIDKSGHNSGVEMSTNWNLNQERAAVENLLYQRLIIFLIVFSVFVLGAVNTQRKILFLSIIFLGVIICWVLTFILIRTAKRIDDKSGGRLVRLLLGYLVPIFCSSLLTLVLFVGSFGFVDSYLFSTDLKSVQLENKIDELKNDVVKRISPAEKKTSNNFKNVDSVIAESKTVRSGKKAEDLNFLYQSTKAVTQSKNPSSKYFKNVDSVVVSDKPTNSKNRLDKNQIMNQPLPTSKQTKGSKNFKNIDSVIVKVK